MHLKVADLDTAYTYYRDQLGFHRRSRRRQLHHRRFRRQHDRAQCINGLGPGDYHASAQIEAMSGPKLDRPASVRTLGEAIEIIRGIWDTQAPGRVRLEGQHHQVPGAMRGPAAAHNISIPAAGPVTRRLAGRAADGWITSGAWMHDVERELATGNASIDNAARAAGREPRQIRRIFDFHGTFGSPGRGFAHGDPERCTEQLVPLAIDHGISVFILITDDLHAIARWGEEAGPALREAVAHERNTSKPALQTC
ncbi:MAG: LLM class flavin-dependent oxidoreductase [Solirubrobacteraceae bacterium]